MGLSKLSFHDLCSHVSEIRNSKTRSLRTCIGIYLTKLRAGMSNRLLFTIFNIGMDAIAIKRSIWSAHKTLSKYCTPNYIGFEHITRYTIADKHTTDLAKTIFGGPHNPAILIIDVTYIYIQKRSQFSF